MSSGPLRQAIGTLGLLALTPTLLLLATRRIHADQAALRAAATLVVVLLIGRVAARSMGYYVRRAERGDLGGTARRERRGDDGA